MNKKQISQLDLIMEFFKANPKRDISHPEVVDWVSAEWQKRTGKVFRDPDRGIRSLHQRGYLQKIAKGVYRYEGLRYGEYYLQETKAPKYFIRDVNFITNEIFGSFGFL